MPVATRNLLIGIALGAIVAFGLGALGGGLLGPTVLGLVIGMGTWYGLNNLAGNRAEAGVPDADRAAALAAGPSAGLGLVYVYRIGLIGGQLGYDIDLDGVSVAQLRSPRFTRLSVAPGEHTLAAGPKGSFAASQNAPGRLSFTLAPGQIIVFNLKPRMGALQNQVEVLVEPDPQAALRKLAGIPMVRSEGVATA